MTVERTPSFVDGIGGRGVLPEMWPIVRPLVDGALVASLDEVARAVRLLVERARVVAEGAGATPVACALGASAPARQIVCVVSGGNIDSKTLIELLGSADRAGSTACERSKRTGRACLAPNLPQYEAEGADQSGRCVDWRRAPLSIDAEGTSMRVLLDSTGVRWMVFEVKRPAGSGERASYLPEEFGDGWLCFESSTSKRRLTPIPPRWREYGDEELERMLGRARPVIRTRASAEDRPSSDRVSVRPKCEGAAGNSARRPSVVRQRALTASALGGGLARRRFRLRLRPSDRPVVLLDVLLVRRRHVARPLEQHARRVAFAEPPAKPELEVLEALDGLGAQIGRRARVLEVLRVRELAQVLDRLVELRRRKSLALQIACGALPRRSDAAALRG